MDGRKVLKALTKMKMAQTGNVLEVGGFSMIPLLVAGDNIRVEKQKKYKKGDIVICVNERNNTPVLLVHRVIFVRKKNGETMYVTKGDNAIAAEIVPEEYCLGKVIEITNRNGKKIERSGLTEGVDEIVELSRKVWNIYKKTGDPTIAFSSEPHMKIYDMAPDSLKENVYSSQKEMIKRAGELIQGMAPSPQDENFVFTRDFYAALAFHRVMNVLEPYVIHESGRYGKHMKLAKARNLMGARKRFKKACEVADALEKEGIKYVLYKGIVSSQFIFGDPNIRECDDVDFLIMPEDVEKAHAIMRKLGYKYHDGRDFYDSETPEEHYHTHIKPYVHEMDLNTVELHTAIFESEKNTKAIMDKSRIIEISGHKLNVLGETESILCQIYVTAVDDYGTANMTYEMDPNIFLQLKFRNYLDIAMMAYKYSHISTKKITEAADEYNITFHIFFAADFTCKIFDNAPFTDWLQKLRGEIVAKEQLAAEFYELPIGVQDCLRSPFKMKMNGRALYNLRNAYYLSSRWRKAQKKIEEGHFAEIEPKLAYEDSSDGILRNIKQTSAGVDVKVEIETADKPDEFIVVIKILFKEKYTKPGDLVFDLRFIYVNKKEGYFRKGSVMQDSFMPLSELAEDILKYVQKKHQKLKFKLNIGKKQSFDANNEKTLVKSKMKFSKNMFLEKNGVNFMVLSCNLIKLNDSKESMEIDVSRGDDEILKYIFD